MSLDKVCEAVLGLGSNLSDKALNLHRGVELVSSYCEIKKISCVYSTASLLRDSQDAYLNICARVSTHLSAKELLHAVKISEKQAGRTDGRRWGARILDIDIIDYAGKIYDDNALTVPHPEMQNRSFVLYPLRDVSPDYMHPILRQSVDDMIRLVKDDLDIKECGVLKWL